MIVPNVRNDKQKWWITKKHMRKDVIYHKSQYTCSCSYTWLCLDSQQVAYFQRLQWETRCTLSCRHGFCLEVQWKKISFLLCYSALVTHCLLLKGRVEIFQWKICQIVVDIVQLLCQGIPHSQLRQQNSEFTYNMAQNWTTWCHQLQLQSNLVQEMHQE